MYQIYNVFFLFLVISKFLDVDQLISCLVQIQKKEDLKVFEKKIADSISLKHIIELIPSLQEALADSENPLFKAYHQVSREYYQCQCKKNCL